MSDACDVCSGTHMPLVTASVEPCLSHWRAEAGRLEVEAERIAEILAHVGGALTGNLKPHVVYPGKPFLPVEEALVVRRAMELLALEALRLRVPAHLRGTVDFSDQDVREEILKWVRLAESELK